MKFAHTDPDENCDHATRQRLGHNVPVSVAVESDRDEPKRVCVQNERVVLVASEAFALREGPGSDEPEGEQKDGEEHHRLLVEHCGEDRGEL